MATPTAPPIDVHSSDWLPIDLEGSRSVWTAPSDESVVMAGTAHDHVKRSERPLTDRRRRGPCPVATALLARATPTRATRLPGEPFDPHPASEAAIPPG